MTLSPNVLLIMSDEQSLATMGCTGNESAITPQLDDLAGDGTLFTGLHTPFPLCCPSRTSLLTGLMPRHHHVLGNWRGIRPDLTGDGLGRWFADAGYHTFYVGKWHVPGTTPSRMGFTDTAAIPAVVDGKDRGRYIPEYRDHLRRLGYDLLPDNIENLTLADRDALRNPASPHRATARVPEEDFLESWQTGRLLDTLASAPDDRPWFGVCSFNAPHFPMVVPTPYDTLVDRSRVRLPPSWYRGWEDLPVEVTNSKFARDFVDLDEGGWVEIVAHYLGLVSLIDTQVGRIVAALRQRGELEKTIIVFTSDHGDMMGAHRLMEKGHLLHYDESVRVPLIIRHPEGSVGVDDHLLSMVDLAPTLLGLAGLPVPEGLDGISAADRLGGGGAPTRDQVTAETLLWNLDSENAFGEHVDPAAFDPARDAINLSVRSSRYRYIYRSRDVDELFDHDVDPDEIDNLVGHQPEVVAEHRRILAEEISDVFPGVAETLTR